MDNPGDACGRLTLWEDTSPAEAYKPAASDQAVLTRTEVCEDFVKLTVKRYETIILARQ